jgi:hypothetical protein
MFRSRSSWLRVLRLYELSDGGYAPAAAMVDEQLALLDTGLHARSRFRSVRDPGRVALYSVHNNADGVSPPLLGLPEREGEHTMIAVREFRRVPLAASSLAMTVFTARPGRAVQVVAAIAHFVERVVDLYQPDYLLLAHSLEEPRTCLLLTAVHASAVLGVAATSAFGPQALLTELVPLLATPPEDYEYWPEPEALPVSGLVSPYAV